MTRLHDPCPLPHLPSAPAAQPAALARRPQILRRPGFWGALVALAAAVAFFAWQARGPEVRTVLVARQDLEQHLVANGRVRVPTRVQISAQSAGLVLAVMVREGQRVKAGDLLVRLDDAGALAAVAQARGAVGQARARVQRLRGVGTVVATEGLRQARTKLERAQADLERAQGLAASGAISQSELDDARSAADLSRAQATIAEAEQRASTASGADSLDVLTALFQAEAELEAATVRLTQTSLVALQDGVVLTRSVEPGDVAQPSLPLLVLAAGAEDAQIVLQFDERNLAAIALGQPARASADAYPRQIFDATVSYIAPSIDPARGSVEVRLRVANAPAFFKPDMTVSADLLVASHKGVLTLPSEAVRAMATPAPWLLAVEGGRVVRKAVTLGLRGEGTVEIASGLAEGAEVIVPDGRPLRAGQRVRAARGKP
ncbi:MAG: efflux RND transporter periplasmic adaptor subunit [Polyangiaceae bacterium]|nr:efflux RND transporter periplasmic adaptor subunit [Polyangiaceae bacterium]